MKFNFSHNWNRYIGALKVISVSAVCTAALMLSFLAGIALADDTNKPDTGLNAVIQNVTGKKELKWDEIFKDKKTFGENMYFKIYQQTQIEPEQNALKASAEKFGMTESEMNGVMRGDISPILARNPRISVESALSELQRLRSAHLEQLVTDVVEKDLKAAVQPSEMFSNGDTSDSGFDLIVDLNRIEQILFDTTTPVDVGGNQLDLGSGLPGREPLNQNAGSGDKSNDPNSGKSNSGDAGNGNGRNSGDGSKTAEAPAPVDPNICLVDPELEKGLKNLDTDAQTDPKLRNQAETSSDSNNTGDNSDQGDGTENSGSATAAEALVKAPKAGDWAVPPICGDVLCFTVEAKLKKATVSPPKANCVACHIAAINKTMKELLSKSLLPGKVTGNAMEPGKCKQAAVTSFTAVNMNVVLIPKPVPAPSHDDLVVGKSITDQWDKFTSRYVGEGKKTDKSTAADLKTVPKSMRDKVTDKTIEDSPVTSSLSEVYQKINDTVATIETNRAKDLANLQTAGDINNAATHYQALRYEIDTMISYFNSYKKIFGDIQVPCKSLLNKKTCS